MSGTLISVIPPTVYDFGNLAASTSMSFIVAQRIDTTGVEAGVLQVRLHTGTIPNQGDAIEVDVSVHGYSPDDPGTDFGQIGQSMANIPFSQVNPAFTPLYSTLALAGNFGGLLKVTVKGTRGINAGTLQAKLSIDLVLKTGGAARDPMARCAGTFLGYR